MMDAISKGGAPVSSSYRLRFLRLVDFVAYAASLANGPPGRGYVRDITFDRIQTFASLKFGQGKFFSETANLALMLH
jgi:hypothetical protein